MTATFTVTVNAQTPIGMTDAQASELLERTIKCAVRGTYPRLAIDSVDVQAVPAGRRYGDEATVHATGHGNVLTDSAGAVAAVWYGGDRLPFDQTTAEPQRTARKVAS